MDGLLGGLSLFLGCNRAEVENDNFELREEDVRYNYKTKEEQDSGSNSNPKKNLSYSFRLALETPLAWSIPIVPRIILRANTGDGNDSNGGHQEPTTTKVAAPRTLAPVPITDWSKIYPLIPNNELWEATCDLEKASIASEKQVGFF
ncbi:Hypothetical predicted protein [Olea europaea subsp. europaea]|uniref:Uncharacterized protein n=1 Tax=Olea europaea subsp. europaea TaxID=158383 RepID=A0A8S0UK53_OLEEU|nr:Hypothetical predicted protein [Olea europaea subsp. europaea]